MVTVNQDRVIGIFAQARYGKSSMLADVLAKIPMRVFLYDTNFEYGEPNPEKPHIQRIRSLPNVLIFEPDRRRAKSLEYLKLVFKDLRAKTTNIFVWVEDLEKFFFNKSSRDFDTDELNEMVSSGGGHQRIPFGYLCKQLKYIPLPVISNTNLFYFGQFTEKDDLDRIGGIVSAERIKGLKKMPLPPEFLRYDRWTGEQKIVRANL